MLFLSQGSHRLAPIYHYGIEPSVGVFWALPLGIALAEQKFRNLPLWITFWVLVSFGRSDVFRIRYFQPSQHVQWIDNQALPCVAPILSIAASGSLVPHLATRPWIHHLPNLTMPDGQTVQCLIFDPTVNNWPMTTEELNAMRNMVKANGYQAIYECGSFEVFQTPQEAGSCLRCMPHCP